jgi:5-methylcytosine-specific restriction protein A
LEPTSDADQLNQRAQALLLKPFELPPAGNQSPERSTVAATRSVKRDPAVVAWVLRNANGTCELCSSIAPFFTSENRPYLEIHHVVTLASGGPDTVFNTVALCPNCHRAMHFSSARAALTEKLYHRTPRLQRS